MSPPSMHIEIIPSYIGWLIHRGRSSRCTLVLFSAFLGGNFRGWSGHQGIWNWYIPKIHWHGINIVSRSCRDLDARRATCRWQFMIDYLTHMWKTIIANESNETGNGLLCKSTTSQQNFERCFNNSNAYGISLAFGSRPILGLQTPDLVADAQLAFSQPGPLWSWVCIGCSGMASKKSAKFENWFCWPIVQRADQNS